MNRSLLLVLACGSSLALALAGCTVQPASAPPAPAPPGSAERNQADGDAPPRSEPDHRVPGHGAVAGARELPEPQLQLYTVDEAGAAGLLNLLDGSERALPAGPPPTRMHSDGRYVFGDTGAGLTVVDSGVWSWDHGDHFHYYAAEPAQLGTVPGRGHATIAAGPLATADSTGVVFAESREAVLLDNAALSTGRIVERFRIADVPHDGILAPLGSGALLSTATGSTAADRLVGLDSTGAPTGDAAPCRAPRGATSTRVALVVLCAEGVVYATTTDTGQSLAHVPFTAHPELASHGPAVLAGRKGRPELAGVAADGSGIWVLRVRERTWHWIPSEAPLMSAVAAGDDHGHIVALDRSGSVRVFTHAGEVAATTELLAPADLSDAQRARVTLTVDAHRAYINSPTRGIIFEIDFADAGRVARQLSPAITPTFFAEVGR